MEELRKETLIETTAANLERWHMSPGAFQRLTPPWERMRVVEEPAEITDGARAVIKMKAGPLWMTWVADHKDCVPGKGFTDVQVQGPFSHWEHVHSFVEESDRSSKIVDAIRYRLPMGVLGKTFGGALVRNQLERTFRYRHAVTKMDLERLPSEPTTASQGKAMTVLITGATGMVGSALEAFLRMRGHRVRRVTRNPSRPDDVRWNPAKGEFDLSEDDHIDAVVHLAGENVAGGRWSQARKQRILESRRQGTRLLCETIAARTQKPAVLVSASGVNFYASGTDQPQDESTPRGDGFLSDVCKVWEEETHAAEQAGIRVARLRIGVILSPAGGALAKMLPAFQLGLAGKLGSGKQRMPWIALDDVIDVVHRALQDDRYEGPINLVAPDIVTNKAFTQALGTTLHRPTVIPVPAAGLRLALGAQMANETLLGDLAIAPGRLQQLGYPFRYPEIRGALAFLLGRQSA